MPRTFVNAGPASKSHTHTLTNDLLLNALAHTLTHRQLKCLRHQLRCPVDEALACSQNAELPPLSTTIFLCQLLHSEIMQQGTEGGVGRGRGPAGYRGSPVRHAAGQTEASHSPLNVCQLSSAQSLSLQRKSKQKKKNREREEGKRERERGGGWGWGWKT